MRDSVYLEPGVYVVTAARFHQVAVTPPVSWISSKIAKNDLHTFWSMRLAGCSTTRDRVCSGVIFVEFIELPVPDVIANFVGVFERIEWCCAWRCCGGAVVLMRMWGPRLRCHITAKYQ